MPDSEEDDSYYCFGDLQLFDARKILPRLEEKKIRFQIETDSSGLGRIPPAVAEYGNWGTSSIIKLFIHRDDESKFRKIFGRFLKL
jgi:hypothetical protein